ncbi:MAG: hypothetical protein AAGJ87_17515, partial [Pseudomonadota bacterium]
TGFPARTRWALDAMREYLEANGENAGAYFANTGVALTTYSGATNAFRNDFIGQLTDATLVSSWEAAIANDPVGVMEAVNEHIINGPANKLATRDWIVSNWRAHRAEADQFGVRIIGAYEGGSHLQPPRQLLQSPAFQSWWLDYHWGAYGAEVMRAVNDAVIEEFPDAILSNFLSIGAPGDNIWIDGHYAEPTPVTDMWAEFGALAR